MNEVIIWAQFAGTWLLVAGPLYQGSVELDEMDIDREGIEGVKTSALAAAPEAQREQITSFRNKATGWYTVAIGALLLAAGETWQIIRHYEWPVWLFWLLMVVMLIASLLNTAVRLISDHHTRAPADAEPAEPAEPAPAAEPR
jgi:hypothetical protein